VRVTLGGEALAGLAVTEPAASVRVLLPAPGAELVEPVWTGNEFRAPGGDRPRIRTLTPWRLDADALELDVGVVVHGDGLAAQWAVHAAPGSPVAVSGPGRGYRPDPGARRFVVAGDETAIPAIDQVLAALPAGAPAHVHVEVARPEARLAALERHAPARLTWHDAAPGAPAGATLVAALRDETVTEGTRVFAAGEAAAMQQIRRHLFEVRGVPRAHTWIRGYWKHGRAGSHD
jgi:NADPH-dependent ferric siderophore reductase